MMLNGIRRVAAAGLIVLGANVITLAQVHVEPNVVYGMYSGTALLLDGQKPTQPNGFGIGLPPFCVALRVTLIGSA